MDSQDQQSKMQGRSAILANRSGRRGAFQMPLHYPKYSKADYETMPERQLDCLLVEYGLPAIPGDIEQKRKFAIGAFLWSDR
ncbi:hypothetical protein SAY87_017489 [Trapa incisa]|uniref:DUF7722 domain-containing protein n=2 Tax=Trapa TaxID=22665 RepID=A0AAN7LDA2_TRANT|nr:hypothetical protein SAY87_017489 [Trapa incisa]KAK4784407.1 hypothetical protein SAY86_018775 [Trapa natans]